MFSADSSIFTTNARVFQVFKKYSEKIFEGELASLDSTSCCLSFRCFVKRGTTPGRASERLNEFQQEWTLISRSYPTPGNEEKVLSRVLLQKRVAWRSLSSAGRRVDWEFVGLSLERSRSVATQLPTWRHPTPYRRHRGLGASSLLRRDPCIKGSHLVRPGLHSIRRVRATTTRGPAAK